MKNIKSLFSLLFVALTIQVSTAQILITDPDNGPSNPINCQVFNDGAVQNFYDSGNSGANYGNNENQVITICPDLISGGKVSVAFATNIGFIWDVDASDTLFIYDGSSTSAPLIGAYNSITNPNGFSAAATWNNPSGCLTFKFVSDGATTAAGWAANISCSNPPQPFNPHIQAFLNGSGSNVLNPADTGYVDICFGDSILFVATGTYPYAPIPPATSPGYAQTDDNCTYSWNVSSGLNSTNDSIWFRPPARAGYLVTLRMTDPQNLIELIKCKVRVSTLPNFSQMGGALQSTICLGDTTTILGGVTSADTVGVAESQGTFQFGGVFAGLTYLPDGSGVNYTTSVNITDFLPGQTITSASDIQQMCVTMEHSYLGDLEMTLTCPNGTTSTIFNSYTGNGLVPGGFGGGGTFLGQADDNGNGTPGIGWQYCFADNAAWGTMASEYAASNFTPVFTPSAGQAMSAGTYKPEQNYSTFIGCPINGNWTLTIRDNQAIDDGYIFQWGVYFNPQVNPNTEYYAPTIVTEGWQADPTIVSGQNDTAIHVSPTALGPHSYTYSVTDNFGCTYDTTVTINVVGLTTSSQSTTACNLSYQIVGIGAPGAVNWVTTTQPTGANVTYTPNATSFNPAIGVSAAGEYEFTVTDNMCSTQHTYTIQFLDDPHPSIQDTTLCDNTPLTLSVASGVPGTTYLWSTGSTDSSTVVTQNGIYSIAVTNTCATGTDSAEVKFFSCDLKIPNVITPNGKGDPINEYFYLKNIEFYPNTSVTIFNRWGLKIYETANYQNDWSGGKYPEGVYYYIVSGPRLKDPQYGFFQILR
jgi:gliding motility-associated-like protein